MPMGRICWRNTARLSWNKTIKPKPMMQTIPPLATICRLLKAMSGERKWYRTGWRRFVANLSLA